MNRFELASTAHHEAGHGCVCRVLGLSVAAVRLGDIAQRLDPHAAQARVGAQVNLEPPRTGGERRYLRTPQGHQDLAVMLFAGPAAEAKFRGLRVEDQARWWAGPWRSDLDELLKHTDIGPLAPLHDQAAALVADLWEIIGRAAAELLQHGELSQAQLDALL
jgi:hypothetical protein